MDSVTGLGRLYYHIGDILLFNTVFSKKRGAMACVGNWVDYFRDPLDKHIDLENMWEICSPHFFTFH